MNADNGLSRITIDISKECHKRLKAMSAILGKSMREFVIESIEERLYDSKTPNRKTVKAIKDSDKKKNLVEAKNAKDLFEKLGI